MKYRPEVPLPVRRVPVVKRSRVLAVACVAAGLALTAGLAVAAIPDSEGIIHACYEKNSGNLRVVESASTCRNSEVALTWNQQGEKGDPGPPGPPGGTANQLFAAVNADGTIGSSRGVVIGQGTYHSQPGIYSIQFNQDIHECVALANLAIPFGSPPMTIPAGYTTTSFSSFTQVNVVTFNPAGTGADAPFAVAVIC